MDATIILLTLKTAPQRCPEWLHALQSAVDQGLINQARHILDERDELEQIARFLGYNGAGAPQPTQGAIP